MIFSEVGEIKYLLVEVLRMLLEVIVEVEMNGELFLLFIVDEFLEIVEDILDFLVEYFFVVLFKVWGGSIY